MQKFLLSPLPPPHFHYFFFNDIRWLCELPTRTLTARLILVEYYFAITDYKEMHKPKPLRHLLMTYDTFQVNYLIIRLERSRLLSQARDRRCPYWYAWVYAKFHYDSGIIFVLEMSRDEYFASDFHDHELITVRCAILASTILMPLYAHVT